MRKENGRPENGTAAVNCDADSASIQDLTDNNGLPTPTEAEIQVALAAAHRLIDDGVPIFVARPALDAHGNWLPGGGSGGCGYWLPPKWHEIQPDPGVLERWRPGDALAAVMGHTFDAVDVDPRNGGDASRRRLRARGEWPGQRGLASTPSGGTHEFIAPLEVGSRDGLLPGVDLKGGRRDGTSRGFVFMAPTIRKSKRAARLPVSDGPGRRPASRRRQDRAASRRAGGTSRQAKLGARCGRGA